MRCILQWLILTAFNATNPSVVGYVTSGLPGHTHRAWLKQESFNLCELPPGDLTPEMCTKAPQLLSAWAQNPYISYSEQQQQSDLESFPHHGKECALECERILKRLIDERIAGNENAIATTSVYNSLMDVWARSGEDAAAAQRAEEILVSMQDAYISGHTEIQPNLHSFKIVMKAWIKAGVNEKSASHRAQRLLEWMIKLKEANENEFAAPDQECFDIGLFSWTTSSHTDAPRKAERLMSLLDVLYRGESTTLKPSLMNFNHLLIIWSKSTELEASQRAEDILYHMRQISAVEGYEHLRPNVVSYNTVISKWVKGRTLESAKRAELLLKHAIDQAKEGGDGCVDALMFNVVSDAFAKTSSNKKHMISLSILNKQKALYNNGHERCKPDVYSFSSVLGSCASLNSSRKEKLHAFEVAKSTFADMRVSGVIPNHVTYGTMLKACARLLPPGKEQTYYTKKYFKMACDNGYVGEMVLRWLEEAASDDQFRGLMRGVTEENIPGDWTFALPLKDRKNNHRDRERPHKSKLAP